MPPTHLEELKVFDLERALLGCPIRGVRNAADGDADTQQPAPATKPTTSTPRLLLISTA